MTNTRSDSAEALRVAIAAANDAVGPRRLTQLLTDALDEHGWKPDHSDCPAPYDQDRLESAARLVHAEHDRFSWRTCEREECRALREVTG